jgi:hypothetical protein
VYDMYPWHDRSASTGADSARPQPAIRAVQVALDRRDNGGDPAPATAPAPVPATPPAAPTRQ